MNEIWRTVSHLLPYSLEFGCGFKLLFYNMGDSLNSKGIEKIKAFILSANLWCVFRIPELVNEIYSKMVTVVDSHKKYSNFAFWGVNVCFSRTLHFTVLTLEGMTDAYCFHFKDAGRELQRRYLDVPMTQGAGGFFSSCAALQSSGQFLAFFIVRDTQNIRDCSKRFISWKKL